MWLVSKVCSVLTGQLDSLLFLQIFHKFTRDLPNAIELRDLQLLFSDTFAQLLTFPQSTRTLNFVYKTDLVFQ